MIAKPTDDDEILEDESTDDEVVPPVSYNVTSYGSDPEVESLVNRLRRGDLIIPAFQRDYVWRQPEASKFIESLLLGLPVPGLFFAVDPTTSKQLVIDGQQRLKTLLYFYDGFFNPKGDSKSQRVFALTKVQAAFDGATYKTLAEHDRIRLDTSIIHATTVKQTAPQGDDTSLYHIFERLNSGGRRLTDQEMRLAIYHGALVDLIKELNSYETWREVFGKYHTRLKDQELILRFFALYHDLKGYERPLSEFLNKWAGNHRNPKPAELNSLARLFNQTIDTFKESIPRKLFRPTTTLNVAVFDSCMVGMAKRLNTPSKPPPDSGRTNAAYKKLLEDADYVEAISRSTADPLFVRRRIEKATAAFAKC